MRKTLLVVVASGALVALTPATALAKHHGRRHHTHARIHHTRIGDPAAPTAPTTSTAPAMVASYSTTTHVLMLTLSDGTSVSGTITNSTNLVCVPPPGTQPTGDDNGGGDDQGGGDQGGGDQGGGDQGGGDNGGGWHHDGDGGGGGDQSNQSCSTANLTTGTPVQFADLSVGQGGANWDTVVLQVTPSTTSPMVSDTDNDGD
jgi:hypothetical protein